MKELRYLLLFVGFIALTGCGKKEMAHDQHEGHEGESGIKSVAWLEGQWASEDSSGKFVEHWMMHGDKMHGQGYMIGNRNDTMMMEKLSIVLDSSGLNYIVRFPHRTVTFVSREQSTTEEYKMFDYSESASITFINDTNDFPREIIYRKQDDDSLYVTLKGSEAGKPMEQVLKMKKI